LYFYILNKINEFLKPQMKIITMLKVTIENIETYTEEEMNLKLSFELRNLLSHFLYSPDT